MKINVICTVHVSLSEYWDIGIVGFKVSDYWGVGIKGCRNIELLEYWDVNWGQLPCELRQIMVR